MRALLCMCAHLCASLSLSLSLSLSSRVSCVDDVEGVVVDLFDVDGRQSKGATKQAAAAAAAAAVGGGESKQHDASVCARGGVNPQMRSCPLRASHLALFLCVCVCVLVC